jgi:hypothetical protein
MYYQKCMHWIMYYHFGENFRNMYYHKNEGYIICTTIYRALDYVLPPQTGISTTIYRALGYVIPLQTGISTTIYRALDYVLPFTEHWIMYYLRRLE